MQDKTIYITNHNTKPNIFRGLIYPSDFDIDGRYKTMSKISNRILSDYKFDESCRKNLITRERKSEYV